MFYHVFVSHFQSTFSSPQAIHMLTKTFNYNIPSRFLRQYRFCFEKYIKVLRIENARYILAFYIYFLYSGHISLNFLYPYFNIDWILSNLAFSILFACFKMFVPIFFVYSLEVVILETISFFGKSWKYRNGIMCSWFIEQSVHEPQCSWKNRFMKKVMNLQLWMTLIRNDFQISIGSWILIFFHEPSFSEHEKTVHHKKFMNQQFQCIDYLVVVVWCTCAMRQSILYTARASGAHLLKHWSPIVSTETDMYR